MAPISHTLRGFIKARLPDPLLSAARRGKRFITWRQRQRFLNEDVMLTNLATALTRSKIAQGPFQGMQYVNESKGSTLAPKLLGTYEKELSPIWRDVAGRRYTTLVNVGAGEGYYGVGFAWLVPRLRVITFEAAIESRALSIDLARLNAVTRIDVRGTCDVPALAHALGDGKNTLLICDVEGFENDLLRPSLVGSLCNADILVESHDFLRPGMTGELVRRFAPTHRIRLIPSRPRTLDDWPEGVAASGVSMDYQLALLSERRPAPVLWLWLEAASSSPSPTPEPWADVSTTTKA
jgi:hypothetical protein